MRRKFLHYGLQRSGTNFTESLLIKNFRVKIINRKSRNLPRNNPLQKHFRLYDDKSIIPEPKYLNNHLYQSFKDFESSLGLNTPVDGILIISKDPYSWLLSYENWAAKCQWPQPHYNYVEEYVAFLNKWKQFSEESDKIYFIKYLDLLTAPEKVLQEIQIKYKASKKFRLFNKTITEIKKVKVSDTFTSQKKKYYLEKQYLNQYSPSKLHSVNSVLDPELMKLLGYEIVE